MQRRVEPVLNSGGYAVHHQSVVQRVSHRLYAATAGLFLAATTALPTSVYADGPLLVPPAPPTKPDPTPTALPAKTGKPAEIPTLELKELPNFPVLKTSDTETEVATPTLVVPETVAPKIITPKSSNAATDEHGYSVIKSRKRRTATALPGPLSPNPFNQSLPPVPLTPIPIEPIREPQTLQPPALVPATPRLSGPSLTGTNNAHSGEPTNAEPSLSPMLDIIEQDGPEALTTQKVGRMIDRIVLESVPNSYQNKDNWGKTREVTTGVKLGFEGLLLKANRVRRKVNHGDWTKFEFSRSSKKGQPYAVEVTKLKMVTENQFRFTAVYKIPYSASAYMQTFSRGVSLRGLVVNSTANAQLSVDCSVDIESVAAATESGRHVIMTPKVVSSSLSVVDFKADEVSGFDLSSRRQLASQTRRMLQKRLAANNKKLTTTFNQQLADPIRMPLNEVLETKWGKMMAGSTELTQAKVEKKPRR
ncbi:hypothetical protein OAH18_01855 [bacterium]|nr:hypothetical protein [bacterium]